MPLTSVLLSVFLWMRKLRHRILAISCDLTARHYDWRDVLLSPDARGTVFTKLAFCVWGITLVVCRWIIKHGSGCFIEYS